MVYNHFALCEVYGKSSEELYDTTTEDERLGMLFYLSEKNKQMNKR